MRRIGRNRWTKAISLSAAARRTRCWRTGFPRAGKTACCRWKPGRIPEPGGAGAAEHHHPDRDPGQRPAVRRQSQRRRRRRGDGPAAGLPRRRDHPLGRRHPFPRHADAQWHRPGRPPAGVGYRGSLGAARRRAAADGPAGKTVHAIVDNDATHKHPKVRAWLARHPRWTFHFTPTSTSWLNAVEGFFSALTRRRLKRGVFCSLVHLQAAINRGKQVLESLH